MDTEFDYISYANAFDVKVQYTGSDVTFERIYGSPGYETPEQGILCKITSNFPSVKETSTTTKGGIVIIKCTRHNNQAKELKFTTTYTDAIGSNYSDIHTVQFPEASETNYEGTAVRKGVLLTRYVTLMRSFLEAKVSPTDLGEWKPKMEKFKEYYLKEADDLRDENLLNELKLINILLEDKKSTSSTTVEVK